MCPTKNWYLYKATNKYEDDTDDDDDNGKPFLTTYQCKDGDYDARKAVWIIEKHSTEPDCYYIIQRITGRYMVSNGKIGSDANRMRVHLEEVADAQALSTLGDLALFEITSHEGHIDIIPHSTAGRNGDTENNHIWYLDEAVLKPSITDNGDGTVTISNPNDGGTVYYTTDGTPPSESSPNPITSTSGIVNLTANSRNIINAIVMKDGISSRVTSLVIDLRPMTDISSLSGITDPNGRYRLTADISSAGVGLDITFTGTFDGNFHTISGLSGPLFSSANNAVIKNVTLNGVGITTDGNAGAICNEADGATKIYNCVVRYY